MSALFTARYAYGNAEGQVLMAGLADDQFATTRYVLFSKTLNPTKADGRLGHDGLHIAIDDEQRSAYGGILAVNLTDEILEVILNDVTAQSLGTGRRVNILLDPSIGSLENFCHTMERMAPGLLTDQRGQRD